MTRGVRGATTVTNNEENEIVQRTKELIEEIIHLNDIQPEQISL